MNDTELDEMLDRWDAPPVSAALRQKVRGEFLARHQAKSPARWRAWLAPSAAKGVFAGAIAGAVMLLLVISQAYPQSLDFGSSSPALHAGYAVISNVVDYADDGSSRIVSHVISYNYKGSEILVVQTYPDDLVRSFFMGIHVAAHRILLRYTPGLVMPESAARDAWFRGYVQSGCVDKGETAAGREAILNYATTVVQKVYPDGWKRTEWRAPDLGCFMLKSTGESPRPGGGYRVVTERLAAQVLGKPSRN